MTSTETANNSNPSCDEDKLGFWGALKAGKKPFILYAVALAPYTLVFFTFPAAIVGFPALFLTAIFIIAFFIFSFDEYVYEPVKLRVRITYSLLSLAMASFSFFTVVNPETVLSVKHTVSNALITNIAPSQGKTMIEIEGQRYFIRNSFFAKGDEVTIDKHYFEDGSNLKTTVCLRELCREAKPVE